MTATLAPHQASTPSRNGTDRPRPDGRKAHRSGARIALGLLVIVLCVLATSSLYSSTNHRAEVLTVRRDIPAGHIIEADDLASARVAVGPEVPTTPVADRDRVVGHVAAVTLVEGSLLVADDVSGAMAVPDGMAVVGAALKTGQYPVALAPGDHVKLVETASASALGNTVAPVDRGSATVLDVAQSQNGQAALSVSLLIPVDAAAVIASDGAAGRLSVVVVAK